MTTKTKIIIGVVIVAVAAAAYYFLVYKPKKDKEKAAGTRTVSTTDQVSRPSNTTETEVQLTA